MRKRTVFLDVWTSIRTEGSALEFTRVRHDRLNFNVAMIMK